MQYSPRNAIMYVSLVDAGTVEVLREMGKAIVSSADLVSRFEAVLTAEQIARTIRLSGRSMRFSGPGGSVWGRVSRAAVGCGDKDDALVCRRRCVVTGCRWVWTERLGQGE